MVNDAYHYMFTHTDIIQISYYKIVFNELDYSIYTYLAVNDTNDDKDNNNTFVIIIANSSVLLPSTNALISFEGILTKLRPPLSDIVLYILGSKRCILVPGEVRIASSTTTSASGVCGSSTVGVSTTEEESVAVVVVSVVEVVVGMIAVVEES